MTSDAEQAGRSSAVGFIAFLLGLIAGVSLAFAVWIPLGDGLGIEWEWDAIFGGCLAVALILGAFAIWLTSRIGTGPGAAVAGFVSGFAPVFGFIYLLWAGAD
jgi:hypothetical protein